MSYLKERFSKMASKVYPEKYSSDSDAITFCFALFFKAISRQMGSENETFNPNPKLKIICKNNSWRE